MNDEARKLMEDRIFGYMKHLYENNGPLSQCPREPLEAVARGNYLDGYNAGFKDAETNFQVGMKLIEELKVNKKPEVFSHFKWGRK